MMFKILILQRYYGLGDSQIEYQMVDASFTVAPRQRNTREENQQIKDGRGDELWNDQPNKKKHKE